jgi:hypothetical protein
LDLERFTSIFSLFVAPPFSREGLGWVQHIGRLSRYAKSLPKIFNKIKRVTLIV